MLADPGEWVWEGRFLGRALSVKPKLLSVLLCVWTKKLLGVLIQYSVQGKVSHSHVKYMEGRRFYLSVCGLGCSRCQNKMTHFGSDALRAEELSCQPTDLHVCVSARVNHAHSIILFFQPWPTNPFLKKKKGGRAVKSIFTPSNLNRPLPIWTPVSRGNPWQHSPKTWMGGDGVGRSSLLSDVLGETESAVNPGAWAWQSI